ncbi:MAG: heme-binding protein, partial [Candidatus Nanopelagicales bacterium]
VEEQERTLLFTRFDNDDAWRLGCLLVELAQERNLAVTIDVRRGTQQLFHAALPGTTPDNDSWIERKTRVVERFGASSYLVGLRAAAKGTTFAAQHDLPLRNWSGGGGRPGVLAGEAREGVEHGEAVLVGGGGVGA